MSNNQLTLPYEIIENVLGRTSLRAKFKISSKESYKIPFADLLIREGYNSRIVYEDLQSVADWVKENTIDGIVELNPAPTIDVLEDGRVFICRGHRRYKGLQLAIEQGLKVEFVVCTPNKGMNEFDRALDIWASNMTQSELKPIEQANYCVSLKNNFGKISNDEIAKRLKISRQKVDYLILIGEAGDDVKNEILNGNMHITDAVAYVRKQKKLDKQTDDAETDSHINTAGKTPLPKDLLADEVKELGELERQAEEMNKEETPEERDLRLLREKTKADQEHEQLMEVSDEIKVKKLKEHIGRKLSANAVRTWTEDFVDEDTSEVVSIERHQTVVQKGEVITEEIVEQLKDWEGIGIDTVLVYKKGMEPIAASVITEPIAQKEKDRFDNSRPEIKQVNNCIGLADRLEAIVNKLDVPDGTKKDVTDIVKWLQFDLAECREYIHKHKDQNKRGH